MKVKIFRTCNDGYLEPLINKWLSENEFEVFKVISFGNDGIAIFYRGAE